MRKNPFTYASFAVLYIACIVFMINHITSFSGSNETVLIPMAMLCLFVLSAALMGFLFVSEPILLYIDGNKKEAVSFFFRTVGFFACFAVLFGLAALAASFL